jgi:hypothetical protein
LNCDVGKREMELIGVSSEGNTAKGGVDFTKVGAAPADPPATET